MKPWEALDVHRDCKQIELRRASCAFLMGVFVSLMVHNFVEGTWNLVGAFFCLLVYGAYHYWRTPETVRDMYAEPSKEVARCD